MQTKLNQIEWCSLLDNITATVEYSRHTQNFSFKHDGYEIKAYIKTAVNDQ